MKSRIITLLCTLLTAAGSWAEWTDVTAYYIQNPSFTANSRQAWTCDVYAQGNDVNFECMEVYNGTFNVWQTIASLPKGRYRLSVQAFYRDGSQDNAYGKRGSEEGEHLGAMLYAGDATQQLMSIYDFGFDEYHTNCWTPDEQIYYPDGMQSAAAAFEMGAYVNTLEFETDADGSIVIGLSNDDYEMANWCIFDNFKLEVEGGFDNVLATDLQVSVTATELTAGQTAQATATITPANVTMSRLDWSSSDPRVITVGSDGLIRARHAGTASMTVSTVDGSGLSQTVGFVVTDDTPADTRTWTDVTEVYIANPQFSAANSDGWSVEHHGGSVNYNAGGMEFWNTAFRLEQQLTGLHPGTYRLSVQGFHRPGDAAETYNDYTNNAEMAPTACLFADNHRQTLKDWFDFTFDYNASDNCWTPDGYTYYTNGMWASGEAFNAGAYVNTLEFQAEGDVVIGLALDDYTYHTWCNFDNFKLEYLSDEQLVSEVALSTDEPMLYVGQTATVTATVLPDDAAQKQLSFSSSDEAVVTVSSEGLVTAIGLGQAVVTATATDGSGAKGTLLFDVVSNATFAPTKRYHVVCQEFPDGCVTDGASAGQPTPLYYNTTATTDASTYWIINEEQPGRFSIRNAETGQYITYDGVRDTYRRYVSMTDELDGERSLWSITMQEQDDALYVIRNAGQTDQVWDVRTDSYIVGTYSRGNDISTIERFYFYDEKGAQVSGKNEGEQPATDVFDVSSWLIATAEQSEGWTNEGGWFLNTGAGGSHFNGEAYTVAPFMENWHDVFYGGLDDCSLTQTLHHIPAGKYTLQADMIAVWQGSNGWGESNPAAPGTGVELFANDDVVYPSTANNAPERYRVNFEMTGSGDLNLGVRVVDTNANWIAIDNLQILFQGTEEQVLQGERDKVRAELADYYDHDETEQLISQAGDSFDALETLRKSVAYLPKNGPLASVLGDVTIDGLSISYVESLDLYLCPLPLERFNQPYVATIAYTGKNGAGTLYIDDQATPSGTEHRFSTVEGGKNYQLRVSLGDGTVVEKALTFTSLPVVNIFGSFDNSYSQGYIAVREPGKPDCELLNMKAKWRGGITNTDGKHKRNYHVKLQDANGEKLEKKFFGLRNDNSWILESCQVDMSRIRNRVLTDLWNDYSVEPYYIGEEPKARTGTRGQFVELVLNGEYRGIYCMTENMDRKQMKLKKYDEESQTVHGELWKSKDWSFAVLMGTRPDGGYQPKDYLSEPYGYSDMWDSFQVKYPDIDDVQPTDWQTLYDAVSFVCYSDDDLFRRDVASYFDLPLVIDYYILMETILSTDNHGKNMFFAVYDKQADKKITFGVWDMDATSGQRWSDDYWHDYLLRPEQDYAEFIARYEHGDYNLFRRLRQTDADGFNQKVRQRYRDLRDTHLATESIVQRFRSYLDEFAVCGADQREYAKWNGDTDIAYHDLDFEGEMEYIEDWFTRRMNYLDTERFDIAGLPPSGIAQSTPDSDKRHATYDLQGRRVNGTPTQKGVYIVNGKKIVRR